MHKHFQWNGKAESRRKKNREKSVRRHKSRAPTKQTYTDTTNIKSTLFEFKEVARDNVNGVTVKPRLRLFCLKKNAQRNTHTHTMCVRCPHHARASVYNSASLNDIVSSHSHSLSLSRSSSCSFIFVQLHGLLSTYTTFDIQTHANNFISTSISICVNTLYTRPFYEFGLFNAHSPLSVHFGELGEDKNRKTATYQTQQHQQYYHVYIK